MADGIRSSSASISPAAFSAAIAKRRAPPTRFSSRRIPRWASTNGRISCTRKPDLMIDGPGKYPDYNFWRVAGVAIGGKDKGQAENETRACRYS